VSPFGAPLPEPVGTDTCTRAALISDAAALPIALPMPPAADCNRPSFLRIYYGDGQWLETFALSLRRISADAASPDFKLCDVIIAVPVLHVQFVNAANCGHFHYVGNGKVVITNGTIMSNSDQKIRVQLHCGAYNCVVVGLSVCDVDASPRISARLASLTHTKQAIVFA